jgi:hypothetical protein
MQLEIELIRETERAYLGYVFEYEVYRWLPKSQLVGSYYQGYSGPVEVKDWLMDKIMEELEAGEDDGYCESPTYKFGDVQVVRETEHAYLMIFWDYEDKDFWVAKSQLESEVYIDYRGPIVVRDWLAKLIIEKLSDEDHPTPKARFFYDDYEGP